jgi:hypothetical protein
MAGDFDDGKHSHVYAETGEGAIKTLEGKFTGAHRLRVGV